MKAIALSLVLALTLGCAVDDPDEAADSSDDELGVVEQETETTYNVPYCYCNTTYHRVFCRKTDGSYYWNGSYC